MKRTIAISLSGLVVTAGVVGVTTASSATGDSSNSFTLVGHQTGFHIVDNGRKGDSAGDFGTLSGWLSMDGKRIGKYLGDCVQTDGNGHSMCRFVFALSGGQLVVESAYGAGMNGNKVTHEAIVGGTGTYSEARGYTVGEETGRSTIKETFHLQN